MLTMNAKRSRDDRLDATRVHVGDLLGRLGASRDVRRRVVVDGLRSADAGVPPGEPVDLDLRVEAVTDGVIVAGAVTGRFHAECSRCLEPLDEPFELEVYELFESDPVEAETYPLVGDEIDLEQLVRDAVVPAVPTLALCDASCQGLCPQCGADLNEAECDCAIDTRDPRWTALDRLRFDEP